MTMEQEEERQALLKALAAVISATKPEHRREIGTRLHRMMEEQSSDDSSTLETQTDGMELHQMLAMPGSSADTEMDNQSSSRPPSPAEMAAELGVTLAELPGVLKQRIEELTMAMRELENHLMVAPGLQANRAQRRAAKFNKPGAAIMKNGRWVAR